MFKTILHLAYKNAFLRRSRAILLIVMIGVSMAIMITLEGLYDGMTVHMIEKTKRSDSGDISLFAKKYRIEGDIRFHINDADKKVSKLKNLTGVKEALWRIESSGLVQTARKSRPAKLIGIDLQAEEQFGKFSDFLQEGSLDFGKNGIFIGNELAKKLGVHLHSKLIFSMQDSKHQLQSVAFRIKAIIHTTNVSLDPQGLYIAREKLNQLLSLEKNSATQIALMSKHTDDAGLQKRIQQEFPNLNVQSFTELYPQLKETEQIFKKFNQISFFIVMSVIFVGILGVMYVSILDRVREFGILLSIGYSYRYIRLQVLFEAVVLGLLGYILGALLGWAFLEYLKNYGLDFRLFSDGLSMFGLDSTLYATIKTAYFSSTFIAIIVASMLSVILPLRKIKILKPIEVIRSIG